MNLDVRGVCTLLQVFDMPTSVRFYRDVLGFELIRSSSRIGDQFDWGWLRLDGAEVMLNTAHEAHERPKTPEPARIAAHRDTCLYFACPHLETLHAHLVRQGLGVEPPTVAPYGMKQLHVLDPDGYALCFQWPVE